MARIRHASLVAEHPVALLYTRVSSDEQEREGVSLPAQLKVCRRYCAETGWGIEAEYKDVLSGQRDDRPGYQRLLTDVRRLRADGRACVVVVAWLHRFGRRVLERVRCREELKGLGVSTHSVHDGGEVSDLMANILASVAEEEVRQLGERTAAAFRHIQESGWFKGGKTGWGYAMRPATGNERRLGAPKGVLDVHPTSAPYVQDAFRRAAAGETLQAVARWAAGLSAEARQDKALSYAAIRNVLKSPTYIARQPWGDDVAMARPVCRWPALVDDATWQRVKERIGGHAKMPRQASGRHLLTGMIRCPSCGARMGGEAASQRDGKVLYAARYRCKGHLYGAGQADRHCTTTAHMGTVDQAVIVEASRVLAAFAATEDRAFMAALRREWQELQTPPEQPTEHGASASTRQRRRRRSSVSRPSPTSSWTGRWMTLPTRS